MKKLLFSIIIILTGTIAFAQSKVAVCHYTPTQQFAMLASDKKFVAAHPNPRVFHFQSTIGKAITYPTADGKTANAYLLNAKSQQTTTCWLYTSGMALTIISSRNRKNYTTTLVM